MCFSLWESASIDCHAAGCPAVDCLVLLLLSLFNLEITSVFQTVLPVRWEKRSTKTSPFECPKHVVMMSSCLTQWMPQTIERNNISREKSE